MILGGIAAALVTEILPISCVYKNQIEPRRNRVKSSNMSRAFMAGAVSSLAGGAIFEPWAAFVTGVFAGLLYVTIALVFKTIHFDDACKSHAIFGSGGATGIISVAFLDPYNGITYGNNLYGLGLAYQIMGWALIASWVTINSFLIFGILKAVKKLRVPLRTEVIGTNYEEYSDI